MGKAVRETSIEMDIDVRLKAYRLLAFSAVAFCVLSVVSVSLAFNFLYLIFFSINFII